jgi:hypothetical protein
MTGVAAQVSRTATGVAGRTARGRFMQAGQEGESRGRVCGPRRPPGARLAVRRVTGLPRCPVLDG